MILVVPMQIVNLEVAVQSVDAEQVMLVIRLSIVIWNLAVRVHVEQMPNVSPKEDLPFVNVQEAIQEILIPIVFVTPVLQILVVPMLSVSTRVMLLYANVQPTMLVIPMCLALLIPVLKILVDLILNAQSVVKDAFVDASEDIMEVLTADLDAWLIPVQSLTFVEPMPNAEMKVDVLFVIAFQDTKETLMEILDA